jgi:hypothetical protein
LTRSAAEVGQCRVGVGEGVRSGGDAQPVPRSQVEERAAVGAGVAVTLRSVRS